MYKNKSRGNVMAEYILVMLLFSIGLYFMIAYENEDNTIPTVVKSLNDKQNTFVDRIHQL